MKTKLHYVFSLGLILIGFSVFGQNNKWIKSNSLGNLNGISIQDLDSEYFEIYELNFVSLKQSLKNAPLRSETNQVSNTIISVPNEQGNFESFRIIEAPVFSKELSDKYPEIKSYLGFGVSRTGSRLRLSVSPQGISTMISYLDKPTVFMQQVHGDTNKYIVYNRIAKGDNDLGSFECTTIDNFSKETKYYNSKMTLERDADDQTLRTYRLAVSVNGEYTQYHGGTVALALIAINATLARVNEVFETDMAVTFSLVDADELIFTDAATDPYSGDLGNWNLELQNTLTNTIGNAAYDIGHMFGASGGGGNAGCIGCVCEDDTPSPTDQNKGAGITSPADGIPMGDNFDIDYVAHEIGHQMGANHTWAFQSEGTGVNSEPGSGTTIMGYAGITGSNDVQQHSDPYFHYHSINQILNNVDTSPNNCAATSGITNNPPNANAGSDYSIPPGTAYVLRGLATDTDGGDILTYCWEQTDSGVVTNSTFGPTLSSGSMNRSLSPTTSQDRYIPKWSRVIAGQLTETSPTLGSDWETVSDVARTLNWALTVRDRAPTATGLNGQSSFDLTIITVENVAPFTVTTPSLTWPQASLQMVNWNVGETANGTINCQNVNIKFSTDGGLTFPTTLASNTPNDGSQSITVPSVADTSMARILVEAADNIFYAMTSDFLVSSAPDFAISNTNGNQGTCGASSVTFNFDFTTVNGFSETTTFSAIGNPAGSSLVFTPGNLNSTGSFTMDLNALGGATEGDYTITVTGTSASITKNVDVMLFVYSTHCASVANTSFATSTQGVIFNTISNLNTGKPSGYSDYTSISTDVNRDSSYDLSIYYNPDGNFQTISYVWIDWNQNCSFNDAGEQYNLGTNPGSPTETNLLSDNSPLSVTIPSDAELGNTIMRVTTKYTDPDANQFPTSCENGHDAEVEDYTINVFMTLSVDEQELSNFVIYPNPNKGNFTIKFNSSKSNDVSVEVFDIRGRKLLDNLFNSSGNFNETINLGNVQSGMYLVNVTDGERRSTRKIIIE